MNVVEVIREMPVGREIDESAFSDEQVAQFFSRVERETELLDRWFSRGELADSGYVSGFELEAWLIDHNYFPLPRNGELLQRLQPVLP